MSFDDDVRLLKLFAMPKPVRITARASSITNSFVNGVIPVIAPTASEIRDALEVLGMVAEVSCSYCGGTSTEWDHLRPLVVNQRPTGFISEIQNLVPACGKCNQSKGNKPWKAWMLSAAPLSPKTRGIADLAQRALRLEDYERWREPTCVDFESLVTPQLWQLHWQHHATVLGAMQEAESVAARIRAEITAAAR
ncbi:HNH endonuclease [Leucobacter chromiireducens]|uniref:HNH endonuclease n=1 Tax=Leucobacter chromiireducens TaxID=283877 RepID=UPI0019D2C9B1|nr:HNH endonuclease [Leucobacter chromiireducens]